jgi:hypothetical protein
MSRGADAYRLLMQVRFGDYKPGKHTEAFLRNDLDTIVPAGGTFSCTLGAL